MRTSRVAYGLAALTALLCSVGGVAQDGSAAPQDGARITRDIRGTLAGLPEKGRARVTLWHNDMRRNLVTPLQECLAAADGKFELKAVPWFEKQTWGNNLVLLIARAGDRIAVRQLRGDRVDLQAIDLELVKGVVARGVIRDRETGDPVAGAAVWPAHFGPSRQPELSITAPLPLWSTRTDRDGRFVLRNLPPILPLNLKAGGGAYELTWVGAEGHDDIVGELARAGRIRGVVRQPNGEPAKYTVVLATGDGYGRAVTDGDGRFEVGGLPPGTYKLFAESPDFTVIARLGLDVAAGEVLEDQDLELVKGGFIVGRIVDAATGKPIVPTSWTDVAMYGPARGPGGSCEVAPVLQDGTFRIRAPAGRNRIYLRGAPRGYNEPTEWVEVTEGGEHEVVWRLRKR
ncbi:MAG: carboxypeptidase-like regulatory domain-containing protein [bacterium]|nr:carboxypeptidase-like regulatory domain-containing protein [bacterium]